MKVNAVIVDLKFDGALPIQCEMRLEGDNIAFSYPALNSEFMIPIEAIETLLSDDLHG